MSNVSDPPRDTTIPTVMGEGNASRKRASLPGQRGIILLIAPDVGNMSWVGNEHIKVVSVGATNLAPRRRSAVAECLISRTVESSLAADAMYELRECMWNFRLYAATSGEIEKHLKSFAVPTLPQ